MEAPNTEITIRISITQQQVENLPPDIGNLLEINAIKKLGEYLSGDLRDSTQ